MAEPGGKIEAGKVNSKLDGWTVLDAMSGDVVAWNGDLPGRIAEARRGSAPSWFHREGGEVFFARADSNGPHFPQVETVISAPTAWLGSRIPEGVRGDTEEGEEPAL